MSKLCKKPKAGWTNNHLKFKNIMKEPKERTV